MAAFLLWWVISLLLGWLALPLALRLFQWLPDRGYTGVKALGILLTSYLLWLGASMGWLRNDLSGIFAAILLFAGISFWFGLRNQAQIIEFLSGNRRVVLTAEVLFFLTFALWTILRAYAPDKIMNAGGEKFMEIAFLNGVLNSSTFPPLDPWLSGFAIAYYYFGYVMMALITRLSGVPASVGFDLYDAMLFGLTALGAFGVVYNLVAGSQKMRQLPNLTPATRVGLLGTLLMVIMGNLEGLFEALRSRGGLPQAFFEWLGVPDLSRAAVNGSWYPGTSAGWWWWRGSRVIQDYDLAGNPMGISPITEFPFFSFLLGDNHPHVLGLPFVILAISLALTIFYREFHSAGTSAETGADSESSGWWNPVQFSLNGDYVLFFFSALLLGGLAFLNTWDFPIYLGLTVLAYAAGQAAQDGKIGRGILLRSAVLGAGLFGSAILLYIFFYFSFDSQAGGVLPYLFSPTRLPQYLVMFGVFVFIILAYLIYLLYENSRIRVSDQVEAGQNSTSITRALRAIGWTILASAGIYILIGLALAGAGWLANLTTPNAGLSALQASLGLPLDQAARTMLLARMQNPWLLLTLSVVVGLSIALIQILVAMPKNQNLTIDPSDLFVLLLILLGFLLTWSVEFIYLRDSFMVRMNTVFKFYYQGWVMLACASAYALWRLSHAVQWYRMTTLSIAGLLILAGLVYPVMAFHSRVAGFQGEANLDGASALRRSNSEDWAAIDWLQAQAQAQGTIPTILEAPGKSYNYEGRISAFTGFPTVLGWAIHESQWRGSYEEQAKREPDIAAIYASLDARTALELLHKWDVDYVILGWTERNYIQQLCADPSRLCNPAAALRKFDQVLQPVFSQGQTTIYAVPER